MDLEFLCRIEPLWACWALDFPFRMPDSSAPCDHPFLGMCLVPSGKQDGGVFGFGDFVQGFALLALVYTFTDVRYRFRIATVPFPIYQLTFWLSGFVGLGSLVTDYWFSCQFPVPSFLPERATLQLTFGLLFLFLVLIWLWYAFVRPPIFGKRNCANYARALYRYLLQGSESDLPVIADELVRSARSLVFYAPEPPFEFERAKAQPRERKVAQYAHDILLLIGNRKLCRHIVASAPNTAIAFFRSASEMKKFRLPIGQFASNISTEAILNKDCILYHEDEGYYSGYFGYVRPFTTAIFGDFQLVEAIGHGNHSPLDIDLDVRWQFDAKQLEAYTRAVLATFKGALPNWGQHSYALYPAFDVINHACSDVYKLDQRPEPPNAQDIHERLRVVVRFINAAIDILEKQGIQPTRLRRHDKPYEWRDDYYDHLANAMFEVISHASSVKTAEFSGWSLQFSTVWANFFRFDNGKSRKIILFKLRRLLYEEIRELEEFPNYKNAAIFGYCLNICGVVLGTKSGRRGDEYAFRKVVISWARDNYLGVVKRNSNVAKACLIGTITFDRKNKRLVKTYQKGLKRVAPREYLDLK